MASKKLTPKKATTAVLTLKRKEAVMKVMKNYGIEHGQNCFMSMWDIAHGLNNTWKAPLFLTEKQVEGISLQHHVRGKFSIPSFELPQMFRAIRSVTRCVDSYPLELKKSWFNKSEYLLWKNYH
jgi:hypothetical protein